MMMALARQFGARPMAESASPVYYGRMIPDKSASQSPRFLNVPLAAGILLYLGLFLAFYPVIAGIEDEQGFVNQAIFWSRGALSAEEAGVPVTLGDLVEVGGRHLPARHPGRSLVALPFYLVGGYRGLFLSGAFLHVGLTLLAAAVCRRMGLSAAWALLVLFHPTLLIYSRTVMADAAAGTGLLLSVLAFAGQRSPVRRDLILAGLGVGLAATMRHHAAAALPVVTAAAWWLCGSWRASAVVVAASAIGAAPLIVFNLVAYGSVFDPFSAGRGAFGLQYLREQLPFYAEAMSLFWPGMFIAPTIVRGPVRLVAGGICVTFLVLLGCYYFHDTGGSRLQTDIIGLRLMQVALPAWIVAYAAVLARLGSWAAMRLDHHPLKDSRVGLGLAWAGVATGAVLTTVIFVIHQQRLEDLDARRREVLRLTPEGGFVLYEGVVSKLMGIYRDDQPAYRFQPVTFLGQYSYTPDDIRAAIASGGPVHLIHSAKNAGQEPTPTFMDLLHKLDAEPIPSEMPLVRVWKPRRNLPDEP